MRTRIWNAGFRRWRSRRCAPDGHIFPYTFYDRYTTFSANRELDRRQPLPGRFAARFIQDTPTGPTGFATNLIVWREGGRPQTGVQTCAGTEDNNANPVHTIVRFDEQENPNVSEGCRVSPCELDIFEASFEETQIAASSGPSSRWTTRRLPISVAGSIST